MTMEDSQILYSVVMSGRYTIELFLRKEKMRLSIWPIRRGGSWAYLAGS